MRAIIVAHGQPGDPGPQEQALQVLAAQVAACNPGCPVHGATLAMPGALRVAEPGDLIYPMFMAEGWFTRSELPRRLEQAGVRDVRILRPFGADAALPGLIRAIATRAAAEQGWTPRDTTLLLSAHGSQRSQASHDITQSLARAVAPYFAHVVTGFVEQEPYVADAARDLGRAVHLPLFALSAEHVTDDLPEALDAAGFDGVRLDPIGLAPETPGLIATAIRGQR
ncbi:sirohydrochlorin chelatase [Paracoccus sp. (in: a-proteobacteria)]|uniref:sirohydrochlorin chelatase n=1 Tax=Paracoccus sp. TaxID=267 RepID=UPI0026E0587C|nr:CbiX/SirB N-terminal domain-containing protein [Paracoccus sp. (in: a-proteobacteria)]MDO5647753.1 CbiX/SirB N-terminal domain-containing protein [Paracoccus sp. (in: a-proteobacteria)]